MSHNHESSAGVNTTGGPGTPVSGGVGGAAAGTLSVMVGGEAAALERARPLLAPLAAKVLHCGGAGAGQAAKLCNNMLLAVSMAGTCEAFALGERLGLEPARLFEVLSSSSGACWSVERYCPVPGVGPATPADDGYRPGFPTRRMVKDAAIARRAAAAAGLATPLGERALALYREMLEAGSGERDFSALIEHLRERASD